MVEKFEAKLFLNEKNKRLKKGLTWKKYADQLFSTDKISYSVTERELIKNLLFSPLPSKYRRDFWLIASGAKREKENNPGYYQKLLDKYPKKVPFPYEEPIDLDLHRTFPEIEYYQNAENLQKLKNILMAFSMRNITIGYCQGFNYIVAKLLLLFQNEEDAFWVFTQMAENYLPFDFYIKFTGVRTDMEIVKKIIKATIKNIDMNSELCISNLVTRCFISLFSQNVNDKILYCIWDAFFIYGNITLYRAFIWAVYLLFDAKMKKCSIETMHAQLTKKLAEVDDTNTLNYFLMMYIRFNERYIQHYRNKLTEQTMKDNYMNQETDPALRKKCDESMPFCLCNKEGENVENFTKYNCLKWNKKIEIIEDYFFTDCKKSKKDTKEEDIDDLVIERQRHYCQEENPGKFDNNS